MLAILGAAVTIGLGLFGAIWPSRAATLVGISPIGGVGRTEIRATYGGLFIALGFACLYLNSPSAYFVAGAAWIGAAVSRLPSLFIDQGCYPKAVGGAVIELSIGLLLFTGAA
jgi:hypothetical protein